jgi:hypothetical protein
MLTTTEHEKHGRVEIRLLAKTDALIDAVVYRLYGLTEEEIGVVEGKE